MSLATTLIEAGVKLASTIIDKVAEGASEEELRQAAAEHVIIVAQHTSINAIAEGMIPGFHATGSKEQGK